MLDIVPEHKDSIHSYSCPLSLRKFQSSSYKHIHIYFSEYCTTAHRENFIPFSEIATMLSESLKDKTMKWEMFFRRGLCWDKVLSQFWQALREQWYSFYPSLSNKGNPDTVTLYNIYNKDLNFPNQTLQYIIPFKMLLYYSRTEILPSLRILYQLEGPKFREIAHM